MQAMGRLSTRQREETLAKREDDATHTFDLMAAAVCRIRWER